MVATQSYDVLVDCMCNGQTCRKGGSIELTDRQARYLVLGKKIELSKSGSISTAKKTGKKKKQGDK